MSRERIVGVYSVRKITSEPSSSAVIEHITSVNRVLGCTQIAKTFTYSLQSLDILLNYYSTLTKRRTELIHNNKSWRSVATRDVPRRDRICSNLTRKVRTCSNKFEQVRMLVIIRTTHHEWEPCYIDRSKRKQHLSGLWLVDWAKGKQYESGSWLIVVNA